MQAAVRQRLAEEDYAAVILTVPSFSVLAPFATLAGEFPDHKFIVDFRDPWTYYLDGYGKSDTPRNRKLTELESASLQPIDEVWVTTEEHKEAYLKRFPQIRGKVNVLPNGYDPEDYDTIAKAAEPRKNMAAICPGALTRERLDILVSFIRALAEFDDERLRREFKVLIYSPNQPSLKEYGPDVSAAFQQYVKFKPTVPPSEMATILSGARFGLVLNPHRHAQTIPSKVFDLVAAGCKVIYLGPKTEISERLAKGGHYSAEEDAEMLEQMLKQIVAEDTDTPSSSLPEHAVSSLTERLYDRISTSPGSSER
jgi:glycosyltransferase involved in cell wall biosynthesis